MPLREKARLPTARAQTQMIQKTSWDCIVLYHHRAASQLRKARFSLHLRHTRWRETRWTSEGGALADASGPGGRKGEPSLTLRVGMGRLAGSATEASSSLARRVRVRRGAAQNRTELSPVASPVALREECPLNPRNLTNDPNSWKLCSRQKGNKMKTFGRKRALLGDLTRCNRRQERAAGGRV